MKFFARFSAWNSAQMEQLQHKLRNSKHPGKPLKRVNISQLQMYGCADGKQVFTDILAHLGHTKLRMRRFFLSFKEIESVARWIVFFSLVLSVFVKHKMKN